MSIPRYPAFTTDEYRLRVARVQQLMAGQGLDALICLDFPNICYLTGMVTIAPYGEFMLMVPAQGEPLLLGSTFEMYNAAINCWMADENRITYGVGASIEDRFNHPFHSGKQLLIERGLADKRLGIEARSRSMRADAYAWLQGALPDATWIDMTGAIEGVRTIKSPAEIAYVRQAAGLSSAGMRAALDTAAAGATDNDLAAAAYQAIIAGGGEFMTIDPIVTVGRRAGVPHSTHQRVRIEPGDAIFMEVGACYQRYTAPLMRGAAIGPASDVLRRMADACIESVKTTIAGIRPGRSGHDIAVEAARPLVEFVKAGFVWHGTHAYSVGLGFPPRWDDCPGVEIYLGNQTILQAGMVFHATTSLRDPFQCGTCFSETVVVTETGCEVLTDLPRELVVK